jgi:hypothetical protein
MSTVDFGKVRFREAAEGPGIGRIPYPVSVPSSLVDFSALSSWIGRQQLQGGGTSAVAPLWAALIALINQKLKGRVGFVNPQLYALPAGSGAFHDVSVGNNRVSFQQFKNVGYDAGARLGRHGLNSSRGYPGRKTSLGHPPHEHFC